MVSAINQNTTAYGQKLAWQQLDPLQQAPAGSGLRSILPSPFHVTQWVSYILVLLPLFLEWYFR